MIIDQRDKNIFTKKPDKIDQHILKIIERFFETNREAIEGTREDIINETIRRIRNDTINSLRQIIIEELSDALNGDFGEVIDQHINDIIVNIFQGVYNVPVINTYKYLINIVETINFFDLPESNVIKMNSPSDYCEITINGLSHYDFTLVTNTEGFVTRINLPETDILFPGDIINIKFIILYRNQTT